MTLRNTLVFRRNLIVFPSIITDGFFPGKRQGKATSSQAAKRHKATPLTTVNTKRGARPAKDTHKPIIQQCIEAKPSDGVWCVLFNISVIIVCLILYGHFAGGSFSTPKQTSFSRPSRPPTLSSRRRSSVTREQRPRSRGSVTPALAGIKTSRNMSGVAG